MPRRPRVVHLAAYGGPYAGSFIPMLIAARDAAAATGATFETVFSNGVARRGWFGELSERGIDAHEAPPLDVRGRLRWLARFLRSREEPSLLHTHFSAWDLPAALLSRRGARRQAIWHLHSPLVDSPQAYARNAVRFGVLGRRASRILCVSPGIRDQAVARLAPAKRTEVFVNGIDMAHFHEVGASERQRARSARGLPPGQPCVLLFAWDWERKGGTLVLEALAALRARGRDVSAAIVGPDAVISAAARARGVGDLVHVLVPAEDVRELYAAADLFVSASAAEGMPFALLEAIACGTPVVASDIESHRFTAAGLPACRLVSRDAGALADAIASELDAGRRARAQAAAESRAQLEQTLSLERWGERLSELYLELYRARHWI